MIWLALACGTAEPELSHHVASPADQTGPFRNRLADATSPYLQQHADNPVDWHEWGPEAFELARSTDRPIFLSIGYAACHWCHVMAHESFEDPEVAAYMNAHFVNIKVDREERPDVDAVYMDAVHKLNRGHGGWPASIWLDTELRPFHAGTYFPPETSRGRVGFLEILTTMHGAWTTDRARVERVATALTQDLESGAAPPLAPVPTHDIAARALAGLEASWDDDEGGWGGDKKFPMSSRLQFLLEQGQLRDEVRPHEQLRQVLDAMDQGGIHDHLGGGFHRYTVDASWTVPHFEKMLYDNAQLLAVYAQASVVLGEARYAQVADDIATYLVRDMQAPSGAFYSSEDADSAGEEGTFYVWTADEVERVLGTDAAAFQAMYPMSPNFEHGTTVLRRDGPGDPNRAAAWRQALFAERLTRIPPPTDTKAVVAWNGLAIRGLALSARLTGRPEHLDAAQSAAQAVLASRAPDGTLPRTLAETSPAGTLEDHAFVAEGLLDLYEADLDPAWLLAAESIAATAVSRFSSETGGFYQASPTATELIVRKQDPSDGAEPSGWSRLLHVLRRLEAYGSPVADPARTDAALAAAGIWLERAPDGAASLVSAHDRVTRPSIEVILAAPNASDPSLELFRAVYDSAVRPTAVLGLTTPEFSNTLSHLAAFTAKEHDGGVRAFVCVDKVCNLPTSDLETFRAQLDATAR